MGVAGNERADRLAEEGVRRIVRSTIDIVRDPSSFYSLQAEDALCGRALIAIRDKNRLDRRIDDEDWTWSGSRRLPSTEEDSEGGVDADALKPPEDDAFAESEGSVDELLTPPKGGGARQSSTTLPDAGRSRPKKKNAKKKKIRSKNISTEEEDSDILDFLDSQSELNDDDKYNSTDDDEDTLYISHSSNKRRKNNCHETKHNPSGGFQILHDEDGDDDERSEERLSLGNTNS